MRKAVFGLIVGVAIGLAAHAASASHFGLKAVAATGPHFQIADDEIRLIGGGQRITVEIQLSDWGPQILRSYQATIKSASYVNGVGAALGPATQACTATSQCTALYGTGARCLGGNCVAALINRTHPDWVFAVTQSCGFFIADFGTASLDYVYFASADPDCLDPDGTDDGEVKYGGTLMVGVPVAAAGAYDLQLIPAQSFMLDENNNPHTSHTYGSLRIVIVGDDNGDGSISVEDHAGFAECMSGPAGAAAAGCEPFDFDGASTVDLADFGTFQNLFTGP